jgi:hypothetical protein
MLFCWPLYIYDVRWTSSVREESSKKGKEVSIHRSGVAATEAGTVSAANGPILTGWQNGDVTQDPKGVMATVAPVAAGCYAVADAVVLA